MNSMAELVLSLCNLVEAEGRLLQKNTLAVFRSCILLLAAMIFGIAAIAFFIAAIYAVLNEILPTYLVLCIMGLACLAVAAAFYWSMRICRNKPKSPPPQTNG